MVAIKGIVQVVPTAVSGDSRNARRLAPLALGGAMALRQTGVANDIVNLTFGLTLGAAAAVFALAFGVDGREIDSRTTAVDW